MSFVAPRKVGNYPYLCTFPGHWRRMYGTLVVVEDLEEYLRNPRQPVTGPEYTEWTVDDLNLDLTRVEARRSFQGQQVFTSAGCAKCHVVGLENKEFCPDLSDVFKRWKDDGVEVLREILLPSRTVEEKYMNYLFVLNNGSVATGMIIKEDANSLTIQAGPDTGLRQIIDKRDIFQREKRPLSLMPVGLLDPLSKEQILNLMAFLKHGDRNPEQ